MKLFEDPDLPAVTAEQAIAMFPAGAEEVEVLVLAPPILHHCNVKAGDKAFLADIRLAPEILLLESAGKNHALGFRSKAGPWPDVMVIVLLGTPESARFASSLRAACGFTSAAQSLN